jgi:hypothetical protein
MVVRKRLDYGSRGHQVPAMPRVPSSARVHICLCACHEPQFAYRVYVLTVNDDSGETFDEEKERRDVRI